VKCGKKRYNVGKYQVVSHLWEIVASTAAETEAIGQQLGNLLVPGDLVLLVGDLGAGKTVFVHGVARGLDVTSPVSSPSYLIIQEYRGKWPVYHCDFYSLNSFHELEDIGWDEYLRQTGVILIEWGDRFSEALLEEYIKVYIDREDDSEARRLRFQAFGERYEAIIRELEARCASLQ
jgi:tRNA threonylcarbamoyladenosine biosynthesis protein TsaE